MSTIPSTAAAPAETQPMALDALFAPTVPEPAAKASGRDRYEQPQAHPGMPRDPLSVPPVQPAPMYEVAIVRHPRCHDAADSGALCCMRSASCLLDTLLCPVRCAVAIAECALGCVQVVVCCPCIACAACAARAN